MESGAAHSESGGASELEEDSPGQKLARTREMRGTMYDQRLAATRRGRKKRVGKRGSEFALTAYYCGGDGCVRIKKPHCFGQLSPKRYLNFLSLD